MAPRLTLGAIGGTSLAGFGSNGTGWQLNGGGGSVPAVNNNVLTLTDNNGGEASSAFLASPLTGVAGGFTASFVYTAGGNKQADGTTFTIQAMGQRRSASPAATWATAASIMAAPWL